MGMHRTLLHQQPFGEVEFPEGQPPFSQAVAAPDIVDENVELAPLFVGNAGKERNDLRRHGVVDAHRNAQATVGGHQRGGLFDRLRATLCGALPAPAAPCAVDSGARCAQHTCDPSTCPAGGAGHHGNSSLQRSCRHHSLLFLGSGFDSQVWLHNTCEFVKASICQAIVGQVYF